MAKQFNYGGQAVIEGVMIRGRKFMVTAIRRPDGSIKVDKQPLATLYTGWMRSTPLLRGVIVLIESLVLGIKTLMYSANVALEEEGESNKVSGGWIWLMLLVSMVFTVAVFFLSPLFLTRLLNIANPVLFNLTEGIVRLAIFVLYLSLVSLMKDIRRVFAYHGAEHKTVNGYEAGAPLEPASVRGFSKAHIRCGGSFLFVVFIIAIVVFSLVSLISQAWWVLVLSRVILIPLIAALGYEVVYFGARHSRNIFIRMLLAPGMWIQALTTKHPDDGQLEVAIAAMKAAVESDQETETVTAPPS